MRIACLVSHFHSFKSNILAISLHGTIINIQESSLHGTMRIAYVIYSVEKLTQYDADNNTLIYIAPQVRLFTRMKIIIWKQVWAISYSYE